MDENAQILFFLLPKACTIMRESIEMLSANSVISSAVVIFTSKSFQKFPFRRPSQPQKWFDFQFYGAKMTARQAQIRFMM